MDEMARLASGVDGTSVACPDVLVPAATPCRPAVGECDLAEACDGATPDCPGDAFAPATMACGPAVSGVCDAPDHCTGTSGDCEAQFLAGVECRAGITMRDAVEWRGATINQPTPTLEKSKTVGRGRHGASSSAAVAGCAG
jgi:hypothetical protein